MADKSMHIPLPSIHDIPPFSRPTTPYIHSLQIGFYGLGSMGYPMARNLAIHKKSHPIESPPLLVYNRTASKSEKLANELGGEGKIRIAQSAAELAVECDIIITNLANDDVVKAVYEEFSDALTKTPPTKNKIFVETSTIYPTLAGKLDSLISKHVHSHLITSPVFGTPDVADKAQLVVIMSGDYRSKKEVAYHLVPSIGRKVFDLGGNLEKAPTFKLIGNSIILGCIEIMAEGQTLAEKTGIGADAVQGLIKELLPVRPLIRYGEKMSRDLFDGTDGFAIDGGIKDASHIQRLSAAHNSPMPALSSAYQHLLTARALHTSQLAQGTQNYDVLDWSALVAGTRVAAGLDGFDGRRHSKVEKDE